MTGKVGLTIIIVLAAAMLAAGCGGSSKAVTLGADSNGQAVTVKPGQQLDIRLASNATTGYAWEVAQCDEAVLKLEGEPEYETSSQGQPRVGAGGWQTFHFKPQQAGQANLKLVYRRPWEKDIEPIENFEVQVTVQE